MLEGKRDPAVQLFSGAAGIVLAVCLKVIGEDSLFSSLLGLNQNICRHTDVLLFQCLACLLGGTE